MITKMIDLESSTDQEYRDLFMLADNVLNKIDITKEEDQDFEVSGVKYKVPVDTVKDLQTIASKKDSDYKYLYDATDEKIQINSLSEYFSVIAVLGAIHPRFIRLPLDEGLYTIDASTRTITPPATAPQFAVKGDHVAETIYFVVDRYYDAMDLAATSIVIQSQIGDKKYLSNISLIDVDSKPDHIIFGWPIGQIITKESGILSFAVRFFKKDEGLNYSLGTLTQELPIRDSLFWFDAERSDVTEATSSLYLKNFIMTGTSAIKAPEFTSITSNKSAYYTINDTFAAEAESSPGATIEYHWMIDERKDESATNPSEYTSNIEPNYVKVENPEIDKEYYVFEDSIYKEEKYFGDNTKTYYEIHGSSCKPTIPGYYYCAATAKVGINQESSSIGPFKVKAPLVYEFDIQNESALKNQIFVAPPSTSFLEITPETYAKSDEKFYQAEGVGDYKGMNYEDDFAKGDISYTELNIPEENQISSSTEIKIKNTLNGVTSESESSKKMIVYYPLADSDNSGVNVTREGLTFTVENSKISPTNSINFVNAGTLFDRTIEWQRLGENASFETKATNESTYSVPVKGYEDITRVKITDKLKNTVSTVPKGLREIVTEVNLGSIVE